MKYVQSAGDAGRKYISDSGVTYAKRTINIY